jgi:hypothetical protein
MIIAALLVCAGCRTFDPKHPLVGKPPIDPQQPSTGAAAYWVWFDDGLWHVRFAPGGKARRFQGSVSGVRGSVADLSPTRPDLKDRVALVGDAVQFDVESGAGAPPLGFDARVLGGCANFDLYVDGQRRGEQVRLGPREQPARRVPFERCP